jgi:sugar/nucleoside kinase (ribokinase family)
MSAQGKDGILCAGSIVFDILVKPVEALRFGTTTLVDSIEYRVGGNAANTARALGILGARVSILGAVGSDAAGAMVLDKLRACGVDTHSVIHTELPTATSVALLSSQGDRQFFHRLGASSEVFASPVRFTAELCGGFSHFHLGSFFVVPNLRRHACQMLVEAHRAGLTTSFDTNWDPQGEWMDAVRPCLPHVDTFFMNEDEARMITGCSEPGESARMLINHGTKQVVIKLGRRGCAIYDAGSQVLCPGFAVQAVDTTGAGDCFVAGFLAARRKAQSLGEAGRFANAVGALTVQQIGAVEGVVAEEYVIEWMREQNILVHKGSTGTAL